MDVIAFTKVSLPYGWLGNMSPYPIVFLDKTWRTSEALFQALRFDVNDPVRELIRAEPSPMGAKMLAKKFASRRLITPWSDLDVALMDSVLAIKVKAHPQLVTDLIATGEARIVEDCSNRAGKPGSNFWGAVRQPDGSWVGRNVLGECWMRLRAEIRQSGRLRGNTTM